MRRTNWKTVSTLVTIGLLAGCMDRSISAPESVSVAPVSMMLAPQGAPQLSWALVKSENTSVDFTVGVDGGEFRVGSNAAVVIPAHGICNLKSSYGPGHWDDKCKPLAAKLNVHAEVRNEQGRTWVDFTPALRFVPSDNPKEWAYIIMSSSGAKGATDLSRFNIFYSTSFGGLSIDESAEDASLRTYVDKSSGLLMRRIKHWSGYNSWG